MRPGIGGADVAARVNGHDISGGHGPDDGCADQRGLRPQQPLTTGQAATWLVKAPFILDVAQAKGQPVPAAAARESLTKVDPSDATVEVVRANYALYQMEQTDPTMIDQVIAELKKAKITVNPRYGRFDAATLGWCRSRPTGSLASPEPGPHALRPSQADAAADEPRVPAGLLSRDAWHAVEGAAYVLRRDDDQPLVEAVRASGIVVTLAAPAHVPDLARELVGTATEAAVVWLGSADGDPGLTDAIAADVTALGSPPAVEVLVGSWDVPGARLLDAVAVMDRLRSPGGCPWDAQQTHTTLALFLTEEAQEAVEAIESGDRAHLAEELGDVPPPGALPRPGGEEDPQAPSTSTMSPQAWWPSLFAATPMSSPTAPRAPPKRSRPSGRRSRPPRRPPAPPDPRAGTRQSTAGRLSSRRRSSGATRAVLLQDRQPPRDARHGAVGPEIPASD